VIALPMLAGAFILAIGVLFGRLLPERRKGPKPVEAVCGCKHHYSKHNPETGRCNVSERGNPVKWNGRGEEVEWEWIACPCVRYTGPEPLPTYIATEIAGEAGE
jgi:hypothetical protein